MLLFDEPTSNLDIKNQLDVLDITRQVVRRQNLAAVVIIHDLNLALRFADKFLVMKDGAVFAFWGQGRGKCGDHPAGLRSSCPSCGV